MNRLLVVDDEAVLRMLIVDSLEDLDCSIDEADNGQDALALVNQHMYDVIVLDYMMPGMTGIEFLEKVEKDRLNTTTVIMLTAKTQEKDQQQAHEVGVDFFMKKPFSPMELCSVVEGLLI
ncbi:Response regulator receiver domain-containing protein [Halolactibacillus halophilus]|uniref:Response regulator receiver domain-containing protein n=1 Tax=Halolactibacillus halophilus TaxID=306540 RepID=A0A1I5M527_9BACI|nr:response regulator [Halolactibacillus halophilus]GEM01004.1 hypothetical protein HHA03_05360 [Halolactibacillus halophilus]SFP04417.1 Response regulator receiver domain-containing protein [Halolactibacillus halophilus]